jgi:HK97 family phage major capsid protein
MDMEEVRTRIHKTPQYRSLSAKVDNINEEKRTIELSFSSETEVSRWFGVEILDHTNEKSIDLGRINRSGPLLLDHTIRDQIGKVEKAWLDKETKKCRAMVRFSRSAKAEEIFQDVLDGIRESVSVGYAIHDLVLAEKRDEVPIYRVTHWEPLEISFTSVPADCDVGVGRKIEMLNERSLEVGTQINGAEADDLNLERRRATEILAMGERFECREDAQKAVREGVAIDEFRARVLEKIASKPAEERGSIAQQIGMMPREVRNFSLCRALSATLSGDWSKAPYERDVSSAIAQKRGQNLDSGFFVPTEMLRAASVTSSTAGGFIGTEYRPSEFIELLSARSIIRRMGATFLTGLTGNLAIPRQTDQGEAYWIDEEGEPEQSKLKIDQIQMSPKTLGAFYDITRKTVQQSSPDIEQFVRKELARLLAVKIDKSILFGAEPKKGFTGILGRKELNFANANKPNPSADKYGPFTFSSICELEYLVSNANADIGAMAFLGNTGARFQLRQTKEQEASTTSIWQNPSGGTGMPPDQGFVMGYPAFVSNILENGSYNGQANMMPLIFGVWNQIVVGEWGVMSVTADPYSLSKSGGLRLVLHYDLDLIIRHIESFSCAIAPALGGAGTRPAGRGRTPD